MEMEKFIASLSLSLIVTTLAVIEFRNLKYSAYAYLTQSIIMCILIFTFAQKNPHLYSWVAVALVTKVIIIPHLLLKYIKKTTEVEVKPLIGYLPSIVIACAIMVTFYKITHQNVSFIAPTTAAEQEPFRTNLAVSLTIFALGLYCILARRDAIKTVHGLCILENGVHLSLVSLASGVKETAIIGIVTDVVIAVFMLLVVIYGVWEKIGTTDTFKLNNLKW